MKAVVLYEASGTLRDALTARGFDAISVDRRPCYGGPGLHAQADVFDWLGSSDATGGVGLAMAHPDCTYVAGSGLHWNHRIPGRHACTLYALDHVRKLIIWLDYMADHWAFENPVGQISTQIMAASQYIQPNQHGEDASKKTGLWLRKLPLIIPTMIVPGRIVEWPAGSGKFVERWANQTDSGQNRLGPSDDRWSLRSGTYPGIAEALADQWGRFLGVTNPSSI